MVSVVVWGLDAVRGLLYGVCGAAAARGATAGWGRAVGAAVAGEPPAAEPGAQVLTILDECPDGGRDTWTDCGGVAAVCAGRWRVHGIVPVADQSRHGDGAGHGVLVPTAVDNHRRPRAESSCAYRNV